MNKISIILYLFTDRMIFSDSEIVVVVFLCGNEEYFRVKREISASVVNVLTTRFILTSFLLESITDQMMAVN